MPLCTAKHTEEKYILGGQTLFEIKTLQTVYVQLSRNKSVQLVVLLMENMV